MEELSSWHRPRRRLEGPRPCARALCLGSERNIWGPPSCAAQLHVPADPPNTASPFHAGRPSSTNLESDSCSKGNPSRFSHSGNRSKCSCLAIPVTQALTRPSASETGGQRVPVALELGEAKPSASRNPRPLLDHLVGGGQQLFRDGKSAMLVPWLISPPAATISPFA
jgi:hypothetical protein